MGTLAEFAAAHPSKPTVNVWFSSRQDILDQIEVGFVCNISYKTIWKWLRVQYDYPYGEDTIRSMRDRVRA